MSTHRAEIIAAHVELETDRTLVARQSQEKMFQSFQWQFAVGYIKILKWQSRREKLFKAGRYFFRFFAREGVTGNVQMD